MMVPNWRVLLFVPVGAERHLASAIRHRPDAIILDLEDAIAPECKEDARGQLTAMQRLIREAGIDCVLRVNRPLRQMIRDIEAADLSALTAIMVPKCDGLVVLGAAQEVISDLTGSVASPRLVALIETPGALLSLREISEAPGLVAMMLGSEDYCAALGVSPEGGALELPAAQMAAACAGRGLLPIGLPGSLANYQNLELYGANLARAHQLGLRAVAAIHPAQLPIIREKMAPTAEEVAWARQVLAAVDQDRAAVVGSSLGMIDAPVVARAKDIISAHNAAAALIQAPTSCKPS